MIVLGLWTGASAPEGFAKNLPSIIKVDQWNVAEITLTSTKSYADPFKDVEITAIFFGPNQTETRGRFALPRRNRADGPTL